MNPELSIVIPVRNEAPCLGELHRELTETLDRLGPLRTKSSSSTMGARTTASRFSRQLQATDPRLRVIRFRRNFGQTAAFAAGFDYARGRVIVTADGDLQNDPRDIPALVGDARPRRGHRLRLEKETKGSR